MIALEVIAEEGFKAYHGSRTYRPGKDGITTPLEDRPFIGWDGEGMNLAGDDSPQRYVLFGCGLPDGTTRNIKSPDLKTIDMLNLILDVEREYPDAFHVGFAFGYDSNQIVKSLPRGKLEILHRTGSVYLHGKRYRIEWRKRKTLTVTRYDDNERISATIYDCFTFFACSFVKACRGILGDSPELALVEEGKGRRNDFLWHDMAYVEKYWSMEMDLLSRLMDEFRKIVYDAGLRIKDWHGPGALASYANKTHGIKDHMGEMPTPVNLAAQYAYAGGRFELFKLGRHVGKVYSLDINSAYPEAIAQLPSLANGAWRHVLGPTRISRFGVYRIRYRGEKSNAHIFAKNPGAFFFRSTRYEISYPHHLEGWYWSPEAAIALRTPGAEILEGWEFGTNTPDVRPYDWVHDMYRQRRDWKEQGLPSQLALKLCLNSLYGKMAQRVGWNKETGKPPAWHQLEWAGWVTSYTRAKLYNVMRRMGYDNLIGVETDGIYTLANPADYGIVGNTELGGWEVNEYDEVVYLQSGFYWLRKGDTWISKFRGLDPGSITIDKALTYLGTVDYVAPWDSLVGTTSRFVGLGAALQSTTEFRARHCRWEVNQPREMTPGATGKRIHVAKRCRACAAGVSPLDGMHDLVITMPRTVGGMSTPHSLPWVNRDSGAVEPWRKESEYWEEMITL